MDPAAFFTGNLAGTMSYVQPGWEGFVVDLSQITVDRALPLLNILRP